VSPRSSDVSNPDKVFFPATDASTGRAAHDDITKAEVVDYYRRIAAQLLPHVARRPLLLERFPDGIDGEGFFQKNTPDHVPDSIERVDIPTAGCGPAAP
jgi:bifunctional non-homologous end joining protein LigD